MALESHNSGDTNDTIKAYHSVFEKLRTYINGRGIAYIAYTPSLKQASVRER